MQRLLETLPGVDRIAMAAELRGHVLDAVQSPNANYVMQKCIEVLPVDSVSFIVEELHGRMQVLRGTASDAASCNASWSTVPRHNSHHLSRKC